MFQKQIATDGLFLTGISQMTDLSQGSFGVRCPVNKQPCRNPELQTTDHLRIQLIDGSV